MDTTMAVTQTVCALDLISDDASREALCRIGEYYVALVTEAYRSEFGEATIVDITLDTRCSGGNTNPCVDGDYDSDESEIARVCDQDTWQSLVDHITDGKVDGVRWNAEAEQYEAI